MNITHLTTEDFDTKIADGTAVVDFWADWCSPCHLLAPVIEELAEKYAGKITVFKVDVDANPEIAERFGIMSIPTVIAFKGGEAHVKCVGVQPLEVLEQMIAQ